MLESILDTNSAVLTFKEREWHVRRDAAYEWAISSPEGNPVGVLRCITTAGAEGDPIFDLTRPGIIDDPRTTGTDWFSIIEYAINEYLDKEPPRTDRDAS